jgi:DNA-binding transcriptional regulator WhiA
MNKLYFTPDEEIFIKDNYASKGCRFCFEGLNYKFSLQQIYDFARKNNLKRTLKFDVNVLKNVDRPETAYYLGLLWSDGHVSKNKYRTTIKVVEDDGIHFLNVIKDLGEFCVQSYKIKNRERRQMVIAIYNKDVTEYLLNLDFGDKSKMSPTKVLKTIPDKFKSYFWLGFFDGDGSIHSQGNCFHITFSGSYSQDWEDLYNLLDSLGCKFKLKQSQNKKFGHQYSCVRMSHPLDISKLGEYIYQNYENDQIGLPRKHSRYEEFKRMVEGKPENQCGYRGVYKSHSSYKVSITYKGIYFNLGNYKNAREAAEVYDKKAIELKGKMARTNFPIENYLNLISEPLE